MPRHTRYQLCWDSQTQTYAIYEDGLISGHALTRDWLEQIVSFSFQSRSGARCTVRKQTVQRGSMYWYGYRRLHGKVMKRYLGRTTTLSIARLEATASLFERELRSPRSFARPSRKAASAPPAPPVSRPV